jgi:two-component system, NarL family, nitrate/nitrite response regulator NarL
MKSILIADPDSASRKALALLLTRKLGITEYCEAGDMDTLIRLLVADPPDILLLDWRMYGAPALETCRLLRKAYPGMKIVLLSVDADDGLSAQECGAIFMHKGASPDEFVFALESLIKE